MAIWIEEDAKVLVQGITGKQGMFHADKMVEYGTKIVGGCTPGKGGQTVELQGNAFPVWNSMFEAIVMIGEIGGNAEQEAAAWAAENVTKPIVGFVAGATAPPGKRMGHAGAIISGGKGTAEEKFAAFEAAGIACAKDPSELGAVLLESLKAAGLR